MIFSNKRITKAVIRLRGGAGWSAPVLFANPEDRFSRDEAQFKILEVSETHVYSNAKIISTCRPFLET